MSKRLLVFTWNLGEGRDALELACKYLANRARRMLVVSSLQELPEKISAVDIAAWSGGSLQFRRVFGKRLGIVASNSIRLGDLTEIMADGVPPYARRMASVTLSGGGGSGLRLIAVHLPNRHHLPEGPGRDTALSGLAGAFHQFHQMVNHAPAVLAGDFNADPFHREIAARSFFWAVRDRSELALERGYGGRHSLDGEVALGGATIKTLPALKAATRAAVRRPLFNPMWQTLPERRAHPHGTFAFLDDLSILGWHCYDQILLSRDLAKRAGEVKILHRLAGTTLIAGARAKPADAGYSDHLPVELVLSVDGVLS